MANPSNDMTPAVNSAGHMVTDAIALGLAAVAAGISRRPPSLRHSFGLGHAADRIEAAVARALSDGVRGGDLGGSAGTAEIGEAVLARL